MRFVSIPMASLGSELLCRWASIQAAEPGLDSPFFRPEFNVAVNSVQAPVEVVVGFDLMEPVAFFAFQRSSQRLAVPVGGRLSDCHGVIASAEVNKRIRAADLLKAADLVGWDFHHTPQDQPALASSGRLVKRNWTIDLGGGYESYVAEKGRDGSSLFEKLRYCERRMAREVGPVKFTFDDDSETVLPALLAWKSQQYRDAGHPDQFAYAQNRALIAAIGAIKGPGFAGVLSTLRAGPDLVAVHFGMRTSQRLHYWFPAYSRAMSLYSPGLVLLNSLCKAASAEGLSAIDLGCGDDSYKLRFATGSVAIVEGSVNARTPMGVARTLRQRGWSALRQSGVIQPALRARDSLRIWGYRLGPILASAGRAQQRPAARPPL